VRFICSNESVDDAYLVLGLAEAKALILVLRSLQSRKADNRAQLNSEQIDTVTPARRVDWMAKVLESAAEFDAGLES